MFPFLFKYDFTQTMFYSFAKFFYLKQRLQNDT